MSRRKNIERGKSGIIFRDGKLWQKEDWYALHPSREMIAQREAEDKKKILDQRLPVNIPTTYYCTACRKNHRKPSKPWKEHTNFILTDNML
jgi:predicted transglutaminase-like protease